MRTIILRCFLLSVTLAAQAEVTKEDFPIEFFGAIGVELRAFPGEPRYPGQFDGVQPSYFINPEASYSSEDSVHQFKFEPYFRFDVQDNERTHFDIREAYYRYVADDWDLLVGFNQVFWGVTESRHLVNIINQIDQVESIDEEDFLGQPMVKLSTLRDWGEISFYILPGFRERTFPGRDGRLRTPLYVNDDAVRFESDLEEAHVDTAIRYSHFIGDWDVGAYYFYGTSREPRLLPAQSGSFLYPYYDLIHQGGFDLQYTYEAWLLKFEGIVRAGQGEVFPASVSGFEYTFFQIADSNADLGVLMEYLFDNRDEQDAPGTIFNNDIFIGSRLALNDIQDTSALVGAIVDLEHGSTLFAIEAERRVGNSWKVELETRWFAHTKQQDPIHTFEDDTYFEIKVTYNF